MPCVSTAKQLARLGECSGTQPTNTTYDLVGVATRKVSPRRSIQSLLTENGVIQWRTLGLISPLLLQQSTAVKPYGLGRFERSCRAPILFSWWSFRGARLCRTNLAPGANGNSSAPTVRPCHIITASPRRLLLPLTTDRRFKNETPSKSRTRFFASFELPRRGPLSRIGVRHTCRGFRAVDLM